MMSRRLADPARLAPQRGAVRAAVRVPGSRAAAIGYLAAFAVFWTFAPMLLGQAPPPDNLEQLAWAQHPALGFAKHPPLPTLVLWLAQRLLPAGESLTYALGGLEVLLTIACAWFAGRASLGEGRGRFGALLLTLISYHTLRLHYYNHNTALLCATAAAALCTWHAVESGRWRWWLGLGACWGAGMLCKYQMVLSVACNLAFIFLALRGGESRLLPRLAASTAVACALFTPHLLWLAAHHFPSFDYAASQLDAHLSGIGRLDSLARFFSSQALRALPAMVLLAAMAWLGRRQPAEPAPADALFRSPTVGIAARRFWAIHAIGPFALMAVICLAGGVDLEMHWGTAFLWALPMWLLSTRAAAPLARLPTRDAFAALAMMQALLMCGKVLFPEL